MGLIAVAVAVFAGTATQRLTGIGAALSGRVAGQLAAGYVPGPHAHRAALALATAGTVVTVTKGALSW